jgi:cell wall assembly regulator SMI1
LIIQAELFILAKRKMEFMEIEHIWNSSITENDIASFEAEIGNKLPADYKEFLLTYNGGMPSKCRFLISEEQGYTSAELFYGLTDDKDYGLRRNYSLFRIYNDVHQTIIPIAEDAGGNRICIGLSGENNNKIYFWDHEQSKGKNLFFICQGFSEFLKKLE